MCVRKEALWPWCFAEEVSIAVLQGKQCACPKKTLIYEDNKYLLLTMCVLLKQKGDLGSNNTVRKC